MKKLIHTVIFIFLFTTAFAHDRQGYIIRTTGDTVKGIVEVYATPKHGVNFREYWMKVKFSEGAAKMTGLKKKTSAKKAKSKKSTGTAGKPPKEQAFNEQE